MNPGDTLSARKAFGYHGASFIPGDRGQALHDRLKQMRTAHDTAISSVKELYRSLLVQLLADDGIEHPNPFVQYPKEQAKQVYRDRATAARPKAGES